jgi:hypothetical protein
MLAKELVQLNYLQISNYNLFETPLRDKDQLKRVILFSDNPLEEQIYKMQYLKMKICDSDWSKVPFEITKLQGEPIFIEDKPRIDG